MTVHHLRALVSEDFEQVNTLISQKIQSQINLIEDLANHIVKSGGKRLRPLLVLLASKACHYEGKEHISLAAMIEFLHTASLLHDDVIDESTLRRGKETANKIWGSKASILVGDYLFTQYMQLLVDVGESNIMHLLTNIAYQICRGELKQLCNRYNFDLSLEEYFDVIRSKTSLMFAASATMGAMIGKCGPTVEQGLFDYGIHLGNAFQLIDDALDYCSEAATIGKNIGDDLADGKATLPLLHVLKYGNITQQQQVRDSLTRGSLQYLPEILVAIEETKAIDYTKRVAATEVKYAISALQVLEESKYKDALIELAHYSISRDY